MKVRLQGLALALGCLLFLWIFQHGVSFTSLFFARAAGEAFNAITPLAYLGS